MSLTALFLYGTLLDPAVLARQAGQARLGRRLRPAVLRGWRRVVMRGTPYPTLIPDPGAETAGGLLRVGPAALARLSAYEGAFYRRVPVRVATGRGMARAQAWVAARWRGDAMRCWAPRPVRAAARGCADRR